MSVSGQAVARCTLAVRTHARTLVAAESLLTGLRWTQWQDAVVHVLQAELMGCLPAIGRGDVDWDAWRQFYEAGRTPRQAVNRALERDL